MSCSIDLPKNRSDQRVSFQVVSVCLLHFFFSRYLLLINFKNLNIFEQATCNVSHIELLPLQYTLENNPSPRYTCNRDVCSGCLAKCSAPATWLAFSLLPFETCNLLSPSCNVVQCCFHRSTSKEKPDTRPDSAM